MGSLTGKFSMGILGDSFLKQQFGVWVVSNFKRKNQDELAALQQNRGTDVKEIKEINYNANLNQ